MLIGVQAYIGWTKKSYGKYIRVFLLQVLYMCFWASYGNLKYSKQHSAEWMTEWILIGDGEKRIKNMKTENHIILSVKYMKIFLTKHMISNIIIQKICIVPETEYLISK